MLNFDLVTIGTAALGGGVAVKLLEFAFDEIKEWRTGRTDHSRNVDRNLEPLLRSGDELVGKLRSLAEQDFLPIRRADSDNLSDPGFGSLVYLFVQFWSEVEIIRFRGLSSQVAKSKRGRQVQAFLRCLESRRLRLIDRISQRAVDGVEGRQRVLQYAAVVHALIDTLDKDRLVTRNRPAIPNKLNKRSKRDMTYRVFGVYLKFVDNPGKYLGPLN